MTHEPVDPDAPNVIPHWIRLEWCDAPPERDPLPPAWRATAVKSDDVEVHEAYGPDPLTAVTRLAVVLADESEARGWYLPDEYIDLEQRRRAARDAIAVQLRAELTDTPDRPPLG